MKNLPDLQEVTNPENKKPWSVRFLISAGILFSAVQIYKSIQVLIHLRSLKSLPLSVSPYYLLLSGLVWGAAGIFIISAIFRRKSYSPVLGILYGISFAGFFWFDLIWISDPLTLHSRWKANLFFTLVGLLFLGLSLYNTSSRAYFKGKSY